jgi:hypothetical protein
MLTADAENAEKGLEAVGAPLSISNDGHQEVLHNMQNDMQKSNGKQADGRRNTGNPLDPLNAKGETIGDIT